MLQKEAERVGGGGLHIRVTQCAYGPRESAQVVCVKANVCNSHIWVLMCVSLCQPHFGWQKWRHCAAPGDQISRVAGQCLTARQRAWVPADRDMSMHGPYVLLCIKTFSRLCSTYDARNIQDRSGAVQRLAAGVLTYLLISRDE